MVTFIVVLLIVGLIAGAIARLLVPGRDHIGILGTILLGIAGSFVGGFLQSLVQYHTLSVHQFHATGIIGSIIGAIVVLILLRQSLTGQAGTARLPSTGGRAVWLAGVPGLEPRLTGPEPVGLPITPYPMGSSHRGSVAPVQCSRTAARRPKGSADRPGQPQYKSPDDRFAGPDRPAVRGSGA